MVYKYLILHFEEVDKQFYTSLDKSLCLTKSMFYFTWT